MNEYKITVDLQGLTIKEISSLKSILEKSLIKNDNEINAISINKIEDFTTLKTIY